MHCRRTSGSFSASQTTPRSAGIVIVSLLELGAAEVNRRFLRAGGFERLLIDTGFKSDSILGVPEMGKLAGVPSHEVVRIEAVAEDVIRSGVDAGAFADTLRETLVERSRDAIALKTSSPTGRHSVSSKADRATMKWRKRRAAG